MTKKIPDWEQKYWQQRQDGKPNPATQPIVPGAPDFSRPLNGPLPTQGEWDISDKLRNRVLQKAATQGSGGGPADLVEGFPYYTRLQTDSFGHTIALFKTAGVINGPTSRGVQVKGEVSGYLIDGMNNVDMSKIKEQSQPVALVEVSVPFLGTFLVSKEAVINRGSGPMGDGRKLLKG